MKKTAETLISAGWVIPVNPEGLVLEDHTVAIEDGRIRDLFPSGERDQWQAARTLDLPGHALLPGFVNCHGHAAMSLLRGFADDQPLMPWLQDYIWPAESRHVSEEFVADGSALAIAEMIRGGVTCFSDMYFFPNVTARTAQQAGVRCQITFPIFDFASAWGSDADDYITKGLRLRDDHKHSELVTVVFGPHAPYTVAEPALAKIATLAAELDLPVHIHLHETAEEVRESLQARGLRPLAWLNELGLIGPRSQCVHMTEVDDSDIEILTTTGAHVIHCPESNMKLGAGICPAPTLLDAGINVALGTDSAASNNDLSLLGEMRSAALLAKVDQRDAAVMPAARVLTMATLNGARALGMEDAIGSLEPGKLADLVAVDLAAPETQPVYNPISQLVYAASSRQVSHAWVSGEAILVDGDPSHLDVPGILEHSTRWRDRIEQERDHD
jgi:5-methylthioadenosine/S-adenosylhomocysteine deaminase